MISDNMDTMENPLIKGFSLFFAENAIKKLYLDHSFWIKLIASSSSPHKDPR